MATALGALKESIKKRVPESEEQFVARTSVPKDVEDAVHRARERTQQEASTRDQAWEFWRGHHFAYLGDKGLLNFLSVGQAGVRAPGKPSWKSRLTTNLFRDHCEYEVSSATQRTPSYQVAPSTIDPEDKSAAELAEKVALFGHNEWNIQSKTQDVVRHAVVGDEGFAWPFWDDSIGPFISDGENMIGRGDVNIRVFGANQVGWEPGVQFDDSPYHYVEYACPPDEVKNREDYMGGKLSPDASTEPSSAIGAHKATATDLVLVREYLERPSMRYPKGRWLTIANNRLVAGKKTNEGRTQWRPYPCAEYGFKGIILHRLTYFNDSDSDRGHGLGRDLVDPMRIYSDCMNRLVEWKNLLLLPRLFVTPGALQKQRITGEPGQVIQIAQPEQNVKIMEAPDAPQSLFQIAEQARGDMARIAAQADPPAGVESARAFQAWDERLKIRGYSFYVQLAKFYSDLMRHCLYLVQKHYDEERLVKIKGTFGWESVSDFKGADLRGNVDVRVSPQSIEPQTREAIEQKIYFAMSNGWVSPERGMHALETGSADGLVKDIDLAVGRVHRVISLIKQGEDALLSAPTRLTSETDPMTGLPIQVPVFDEQGQPVLDALGQPIMQPRQDPIWMPQEWDHLPIWKAELHSWFQTEEAEHLAPPVQEAANHVYQAILMVEARQAQRAAMEQQMMAEQQGMDNAAKPQGPAPMPDGPAPPTGNPAPTRNQPPNQRQ